MSNVNKKKGMGIIISTVLSVAIFGAGLELDINSGASGKSIVFLTGAGKKVEAESMEPSETQSESESAASEESSLIAEVPEESGDNKSDTVSDVAAATETQEDEEQGPERMEDFSAGDSDGMYDYESNNYYTIITDGKFIAPHAATFEYGEEVLKYPNLLEGKEIRRFETRKCGEYLFDIEGEVYAFSEYSDGFKPVEKNAVNPCMADGIDIAYIVPKNADQTVGDLYIQNGILDDDLRLVATDVVAASNGVVYENAFEGYFFYYLKYADGKYSLNEAWIDNNLNHDTAKPKWEKVLFEGKYMPLYCSQYSLYYYDLDSKDLYFVDYYHNEDGDVKKVYTGDFDSYYGFHTGGFMFTKGDEVYYYVNNNTGEADLILTTGIEKIVYRGLVSDYGYNGGHKIQSAPSYCIYYDKNGEEYVLGFDTKDSCYKAVKASHRIEEKEVTYFAGSNLMYIEDGVVYVDSANPSKENGFDTFIKFDKEEAVDYCCDYIAKYFFVYTKEGNLYYYDGEKKEYVILDSGLDPDKDGTGCNFVWDIKEERLLYGKDGKMYSFDPEYNKLKEIDLTYFYFSFEDSIDYCYYKDSDEKYVFQGNRAHKIFSMR